MGDVAMAIGEWIALAVLLSLVASGYAAILVKLAVLGTRLKEIETNHLPTLTRQVEKLAEQSQDYMEQSLSVTVRLESAVARIEKAEERLNGR